MKEKPARRTFAGKILVQQSAPASRSRARQPWQRWAGLAMLCMTVFLIWRGASDATVRPISFVAIGLLILAALWQLPKWQVAGSQGLTPENRFDRENEARKTVAQIFGGVFLLAGLYSSTQTLDTQTKSLEMQTQSLNTAREGQITDRFTKAIDQLGAVDSAGKPRLEIRLGGIYALGRIAEDSPRDYWTVMDVLATYVRVHAPPQKDVPLSVLLGDRGAEQKAPELSLPPPTADIGAILKVIGERYTTHDRVIDLTHVGLAHCELVRGNLTSVDLTESSLSFCNLYGSGFDESYLIGTDFRSASLDEVTFLGAHLEAADLRGASFVNADFTDVQMRNANIQGVDFSRARKLTQDQINSARGDKHTILPAGLRPPPRWSK